MFKYLNLETLEKKCSQTDNLNCIYVIQILSSVWHK